MPDTKISDLAAVTDVQATDEFVMARAGASKKITGASLAGGLSPSAHVYHDANQAINSAAVTTLAYNTERFDTDTIHDTSITNSRLTCKTAGVYLIIANILWQATAGGTTRELMLLLNGTTTIGYDSRPTLGAGSGVRQIVSAVYQLAVNDYVETQVQQDSGGALSVLATGNYSPEFSMVKVA